MFRFIFAVVIALTLVPGAAQFAKPAQAADLAIARRHVAHTHNWHRYARCPDRLSCYPLYGAYGPYGGAAYWGAYGYYATSYPGYR